MERKKAEREKIKAAQEEKKRQQQGAAGADEAGKLKIPGEEEDLVDALLKEIRQGTTLRRRSMRMSGGGSQQRSSVGRGFEMKKDELARLQKIYQKAVIEEENETSVSPETEQNKETEKLSDTEIKCKDSYKRQRQGAINGTENDDNSEQGEQFPGQEQQDSSVPSIPHYETTI